MESAQRTLQAILRDPDSVATRSDVERYLFLPGETVLARSDEVSDPVDIKQLREFAAEPHPDVRKYMRPLGPTSLSREISEHLMPRVQAFLQKYAGRQSGLIKEIGFFTVSGWRGVKEGSKVYLCLCVDKDKITGRAAMKELATEAVTFINNHQSATMNAELEHHSITGLPSLVIVDSHRWP